jgi:putative transposase
MSQYRRLYIPGGCYFFTVVTHKRSPILIDHIVHLKEAFNKVKNKFAFQTDAIVILPDHLHCIWNLPDNDNDFSTRWRLIKRLFSIELDATRNKHQEKLVWQRRFWEHCIRDDRDWRRHMDYIHYNPVKHGLATSPRDWKYSSFRRCVEEGLYDLNWGAHENDYKYENLDLE